MKKNKKFILYLLITVIGIFLVTGCMEDQTSERTSKRKSDRKSSTNQVREQTDKEGWWKPAFGTEQPSDPNTTEESNLDEATANDEQTSQEPTEDSDEQAVPDGTEKLYGTWYIWIPGSAQNLYDEDTGNYVTHEFVEGSYSGKIKINKNGSYTMSHDIWGKDETVEGEWRLSSPEEINGEQVQAIILKNGIGNIDWAIAPSPNGKIRLLYSSQWDDKSTLWMFDSELYKK